jgi:hypothetical protein
VSVRRRESKRDAAAAPQGNFLDGAGVVVADGVEPLRANGCDFVHRLGLLAAEVHSSDSVVKLVPNGREEITLVAARDANAGVVQVHKVVAAASACGQQERGTK